MAKRGSTMPNVRTAVSSGLLLVAAMAVARAQSRDAAGVPDDRALSVGRWDVVAVEWDGRPVERELLAMFQVIYRADGSWAVLFKRMPVAEGTSTNHQDTAPKTFEMQTLGSEAIKPVRNTGIYRIDGDTRVLCMVREGSPRPDEFSAPRHSGRMLVTLARAKGDRPDRGGGRQIWSGSSRLPSVRAVPSGRGRLRSWFSPLRRDRIPPDILAITGDMSPGV